MKNFKQFLFLVIAILSFNTFNAYSQKDTIIIIHSDAFIECEESIYSIDPIEQEEPEEDPENIIFIHVKNMPEFPGGIPALKKWLAEHVNYPAIAKENGIQGTVYLRFVVKKDGTIGKVKILRGVDPLLDEEAIKVVKKLPRFKPGEQNGKKVNVWFSIPISFKLN